MGDVNFDVLHGLPFYLLLGVLSGIAAIGFTKLLYWVEDLFGHLPIDDLWHPAIGALGLGIIGFFVPRVLGVGYDTISDILKNNLALKLLLIVGIFKALAMVISLGSGTSGGLLAPMFMSSAALGGAFAMVMNMIFPSLHLSPGAYALVAMAAVFGSASRATFAFIVFAFEITHDYNAILPLMLACVIADMIALRYLPNSIMTEKLARRGLKVPDQFEVNAMKVRRVGEVMRTDVKPIAATMTVADLAKRMGSGETQFNLTQGLPIVSAEGKLVGVVTQGDLLRALETDPNGSKSVLEAGSGQLFVTYPDELVHDAMHTMLDHDIGRLPVVSREDHQELLGYFNRSCLLAAWSRQAQDENLRERGWIHGWRNPRKSAPAPSNRG
jgi:chloride channel protein, CIC family